MTPSRTTPGLFAVGDLRSGSIKRWPRPSGKALRLATPVERAGRGSGEGVDGGPVEIIDYVPLIRIAENGSGQTWHRLRWELEKMHRGRFNGRAGLVHQRTEATTAQRVIFRALGLDEPPRFLHLEAADSAESA